MNLFNHQVIIKKSTYQTPGFSPVVKAILSDRHCLRCWGNERSLGTHLFVKNNDQIYFFYKNQ